MSPEGSLSGPPSVRNMDLNEMNHRGNTQQRISVSHSIIIVLNIVSSHDFLLQYFQTMKSMAILMEMTST